MHLSSTSEALASEDLWVFCRNPKNALKAGVEGWGQVLVLQIILLTTNVPNLKFISLPTRNVSFWRLIKIKFWENPASLLLDCIYKSKTKSRP